MNKNNYYSESGNLVYFTIKSSLINKEKSFLSHPETDYLLENEEELEDIISKIYSNFLKYKDESNNRSVTVPVNIKEFVKHAPDGFLEDRYLWSSYYLKTIYFPKTFFNKSVDSLEEMLDLFILKKKENPYSFILSDKGFEVVRDFVNDYCSDYTLLEQLKMENKLNGLVPEDYMVNIVVDYCTEVFGYSKLNKLIENYLLENI